MELNVQRFSSPTTALQMARDGDTLYFPGIKGGYEPPTNQGFMIDKSIRIRGDGPSDAGTTLGTVFHPHASSPLGGPIFVVSPTGSGTIGPVVFEDFKVKPPGANAAAIKCDLAAGQRVSAIRLERVSLYQPGLNPEDPAFQFKSADLDGIGMLAMIDCAAYGGRGLGIEIENVRSARFVRVVVNAQRNGGIRCTRSGVAMYLPAFDDNNIDPVAADQGQLKLVNCRVARVDAGHFENFSKRSPYEGCRFDGSGGAAVIGGCFFGHSPSSTDQKGIIVDVAMGSGALDGPATIQPNNFKNVKSVLLGIQSGVTDVIVMPQFNRVETGSDPAVIQLPPSASNPGSIAMPYVRRNVAIGVDDSPAGVIPPSASSAPMGGLLDGMLYYDSTLALLRLRVAGTWKNIVLEM